MNSKLLAPDSKLSQSELVDIFNSEGIETAIECLKYLGFNQHLKQYTSLLKGLIIGVSDTCEDSKSISKDVLADLEACNTDIEEKARKAAGEAHNNGCCIESCAALTVISASAGAFSNPNNKAIYAIDACNAAALAHVDCWGYVEEVFLNSFQAS